MVHECCPKKLWANKSTLGKALQAWIHSHGGEFTEESLGALNALQEAWLAEHPGPASPLKTPKTRAKRRPKSAPPTAPPTTHEHAVVARDNDSMPARRLTWNDLNALHGRACLTERHIPQTCLAMLGGLLGAPPYVSRSRTHGNGALAS